MLFRAPSTLTRGERKLIAAYVSALNDCRYCSSSHSACAAARYREAWRWWSRCAPTLAPLRCRPTEGLADDRLGGTGKQQRRHREQVTRPARRARRIREIHDTVLIAAAFCMFNGCVDGLATTVPDNPALYTAGTQRLIAHGYVAPRQSLAARAGTPLDPVDQQLVRGLAERARAGTRRRIYGAPVSRRWIAPSPTVSSTVWRNHRPRRHRAPLAIRPQDHGEEP